MFPRTYSRHILTQLFRSFPDLEARYTCIYTSEYRCDICPHIPKAGITLIILIASHGSNSITDCNATCDDYQIKFDA